MCCFYPLCKTAPSFEWFCCFGGCCQCRFGGNGLKEKLLEPRRCRVERLGPYQSSELNCTSLGPWYVRYGGRVQNLWGEENAPEKAKGGGPKPLSGRGVLREVFLPPLFSTPLIFSRDVDPNSEERGFARTPPTRYGPSSSLSTLNLQEYR